MIIFALLLAIFYNKIGDLFRFGFSFTGMLTIYMIPFLCAIIDERRKKEKPRIALIVVYSLMIAVGVFAFLSQFFV